MPVARHTPLRRALRLLAIYLGLVAFFLFAVAFVDILPRGAVMQHLRESLPLLEREGLYPAPVFEDSALMLDNYSDALLLNIAASRDDISPLQSGLLNLNAGEDDPIAGLRKTVAGELPSMPYARYWHGYEIVLRPALVFMSLGEIRYLNIIVFAVFLLATLQLMLRRAGPTATWAFALALTLAGFYVVPLSLQYTSCAMLMLLAVICVLLWAEQPTFEGFDIELFFIVGMLTSFFDQLSAPLLTLGMPLVALLIVRTRSTRTHSLGQDSLVVVKLSVAWAVGYVASWTSKWLLATLITGTNVMREAATQVAMRTGFDAAGGNNFVAAMRNNLLRLTPTIRQTEGGPTGLFLPLALIVAAALVWLFLFWRFRHSSSRIKKATRVFLVAPLPYLWFAFAQEHSALHYWFTYRIQAITIFAIAYVALESVDFGLLGRRMKLLEARGD